MKLTTGSEAYLERLQPRIQLLLDGNEIEGETWAMTNFIHKLKISNFPITRKTYFLTLSA